VSVSFQFPPATARLAVHE